MSVDLDCSLAEPVLEPAASWVLHDGAETRLWRPRALAAA